MKISKVLFSAALIAAPLAYAQYDDHAGHAAHGVQGGAAAVSLSEGEIRKIDTDNLKLTVRHGPLLNLNMPGMTMVFAVKDSGMLEGLEQGSRIHFLAERIDGIYTIVRIEKQM
ncbi:copper-binding protein [Oxalicibacterium faecigallinarum]|uniref:Copper-binding protein n=1 Tax=Oxalicibacterium faecigallinarum TaxID=573741 RepID=A0A8J3ALW6_9BURK|nr:copper-binding protein [Oxalicibacterium faecigallinarum]GGI16873.1 hypothetical protein GCM10008066_06140 [Oxalicibacterium faecigallinarum]